MKPSLFPLLLLSAAAPLAAQETHTFATAADGQSIVEITSIFSPPPATGFVPLRIAVTNGTESDQSVRIDTSSESNSGSSAISTFSINAPRRGTTVTELMAPAFSPHVSTGYDHSSFNIDTTAAGRIESFRMVSSGLGDLPCVAFSTALVGKNLDDINNGARSSGPSSWRYQERAFASSYIPAQLPSDWRGLSGIDVLVMTTDDWRDLDPSRQLAVRHWIALGGQLELRSKGQAPDLNSLGLALEGGTEPNGDARRGLGSVRFTPWNGIALGSDTFRAYSAGNDRPTPERIRHNSGVNVSSLLETIGPRAASALPVGLILLAFGILVGPLNLFKFAGPTRRHRLFITTPLISLGASLVLLGFILARDGTGGRGRRSAVIYINPDDHSACIRQEQICRTGVLLGSSFSTRQPATVSVGAVSAFDPSNPAVSFSNSSGDTDLRCAFNSPTDLSGDWFQSRSEQVHFIKSVTATRGRIEISGSPDAPSAVSSFDFPLDSLFWRDATDQWWQAPSTVTTGTPTPLTKVPSMDLSTFIVARAVSPKGRWFLATTSDPRAGLVDTLPSIRWERNDIILCGPVP
jgi:hypothetical protein